jgi:hypothetical protein
MVSRGSVIGIDVGWSIRSRTSAFCKIRWNEDNVEFYTECFSADRTEQISVFKKYSGEKIEAAAFDGPIRRDLHEIGEYRSAEKALTVHPIRSLIGKPGQSNSKNGRILNQYTNMYAKDVIDCFHCHIQNMSRRYMKKRLLRLFLQRFWV